MDSDLRKWIVNIGLVYQIRYRYGTNHSVWYPRNLWYIALTCIIDPNATLMFCDKSKPPAPVAASEELMLELLATSGFQAQDQKSQQNKDVPGTPG